MHIIRKRREEYRDERGAITPLYEDARTPITSVVRITSKAGSVRSNHYHKIDMHCCYILSGRAEWHEQPVAGGETERAVIEAGDMVCTPPMTIHAVKFLEDTVMLAFATSRRDQESYEGDTVRVPPILT